MSRGRGFFSTFSSYATPNNFMKADIYEGCQRCVLAPRGFEMFFKRAARFFAGIIPEVAVSDCRRLAPAAFSASSTII